MKLRQLVILFTAMSGIAMPAWSQNAPVTEPQLMYTQSNHFLLGRSSLDGLSLSYRYGWHKTGSRQNHLEVDFSRVRHPKEVRRQGYTESQNMYSYGRMNVVFFLRGSLGQTIAITERPYKNALGLNFVYSVGGTLGLLKPVYIDVYHPDPNQPGEGYLVSEKFDPEKHLDVYRIYGNSSFTKGIGETALRYGGFGRAALQVEWGQYSDESRCLEAGITADLFTEGVPILARRPEDQFFLGMYIALAWGNRK